MAQPAAAAEIKVLTTGAFKQVVVALVLEFEKATGHKVVVDNGTVGQLQKRVDDGESFDVLVLSPKCIEDYIECRQDRGGHQRAGRLGRCRRDGEGGRAEARRRHRRRVQEGAAGRQDGRLHRSGQRWPRAASMWRTCWSSSASPTR